MVFILIAFILILAEDKIIPVMFPIRARMLVSVIGAAFFCTFLAAGRVEASLAVAVFIAPAFIFSGYDFHIRTLAVPTILVGIDGLLFVPGIVWFSFIVGCAATPRVTVVKMIAIAVTVG